MGGLGQSYPPLSRPSQSQLDAAEETEALTDGNRKSQALPSRNSQPQASNDLSYMSVGDRESLLRRLSDRHGGRYASRNLTGCESMGGL